MSGRSYTLSARAPFTAEWRKSHHEDAAQALLAAWRKQKKDWVVDGVALGQQIVLDRGGLVRALDRMDELIGETPKATAFEAAVQVLRELAGADALADTMP
jgi:hypothetical protein